MLTPIRRSGATQPAGTRALLTDCHQRIRHFTALALRLALAKGAAPAEIADAAAGLLRYFTVALPLHSADEDESIAPRLANLDVSAEIAAAVTVMTTQHEVLHECIAQLVPSWRALAEEPARLPELAAEMDRDAAELASLWQPHLELEEVVVFPAMERYLSAMALDEIAAEIRARRGIV